jgi:CRP-like cAMP-binding protein
VGETEFALPPRPDWRALIAGAGLDERELRAACRRRRYARGETIFHEGDPASALHLLDVGHVEIRLTTVRGDVSIIDVLGPGDTFGEQALIQDDLGRAASVTPIGKVETLSLDKVRFRALQESSPAVDHFLLLVISNRLRDTTRQLLEARFLPAEQRPYRCLDRLAAHFDDSPDGFIPLTQADVASMSGTTRSTANRVLRQAERDGVIDIGRSRIRVTDLAALRRRAVEI